MVVDRDALSEAVHFSEPTFPCEPCTTILTGMSPSSCCFAKSFSALIKVSQTPCGAARAQKILVHLGGSAPVLQLSDSSFINKNEGATKNIGAACSVRVLIEVNSLPSKLVIQRLVPSRGPTRTKTSSQFIIIERVIFTFCGKPHACLSLP